MLVSDGVDEDLKKLVEAAAGGTPKAFTALVDALRKGAGAPVATLRELFGHAEALVRRAALLAAKTRIPKEPALVPLVTGLAHDADIGVRRTVAEIAEGEAMQPLDGALEDLLHDDEESVRLAAAKSARRKPALESALLVLIDEQHETNWKVRQAAAQALESDSRSRVALAPLLTCIVQDTMRAVSQAAAAAFESLLKVDGWPATVKPDLAQLESAQVKLTSYGAMRFPATLQWIEQHTANDIDLKKLREFGADLTAEAEAGKLPRAFGVEATVEALRKVLVSGKTSRAAVLLGETGAGKTAIVNELAHRLRGEGWRILRFSPVELLAGTKYLGEWQTKLNELMRAVKAPRKVILYCPNLEELSDAGRTSVSDINMATALAPRIESGEIAILGESTPESFRAGLGAIASLRRLFHAIEVKEKTLPETRTILEHIRGEAGVEAPGAVLDRMIELADYYLAGTTQPGRAAGLFRRVLESHAGKEGEALTARDVLRTLSLSTGVPVDLLDDGVSLELPAVRAFFETRVMGQEEAIDAVVDLVALVKAGLTDPGKPFGVFLFVGPTGVGKTELARALAEYLFGDPKRMIRFDMSEFATYDAFERLIGRGDKPGLLTGAVRERPFSVLLLDEVEKAHSNVFDLCLQLFDAGRLTDAQGRTADFRRTIIVMTSNVGSRIGTEAALGFGGESARGHAPSQDHILRELSRFFRPEFLNRLDRVVTFRPLAMETAEKIARREVTRVLERSGIARRGLVVDVDPAALALLLREGYSPAFGARPLKRTVEKLALLPVARAIAAGGIPTGAMLRLVARGDRIDVEVARTESVPGEATPVAERALGERTADLTARVATLRGRAAPLASRMAELLAASGAKGFWSDHEAARRTLDEVHRLDGLLSTLETLEKGALAESERAARKRMQAKDAARIHEKLDALDADAMRISFLLACRDPRDLGDAYVLLTLVKSTGAGLDAVGRLGSMYAGLALRRGLDVEVLNDRRGGNPHEDSITLLVSGAGAYATLAGETGLHQLLLGRTEGKGVREDRDVVRVEVLSAPGDAEFGREEIRSEARSLKGMRGRMISKPNLELQLLHVATMTSVHAWTEGEKSKAVDRMRPLLRARVDARTEENASLATIVRRYTLGPSPLVRDLRTGRTTGRLAQVLDGELDLFLTLPTTTAAQG